MSNKVYLEKSHIFIYQRIANSIGVALARSGFEVYSVSPRNFNVESFSDFLASCGDATYISNGFTDAIQGRVKGSEKFFYEIFTGRIIFIHQDAILGGSEVLDATEKMKGWLRVSQRSTHLCLDPIDVSHLKSIGLHDVQLISHATEIIPVEPTADEFLYQTSFVGHVVPSKYRASTISSQRVQDLIDSAVGHRQLDLSSNLGGFVEGYVTNFIGDIGSSPDQAILKVAYFEWIRSRITDRTLPFRGWVFENLQLESVDIFGGDPAPMYGLERSVKIENPSIRYHNAVYDLEKVSSIYRNSIVSINVSSLQFDDAVVNRFHDVIMSGGLCLTDAKSGLADLTSAYADVSFRNLTECFERVVYFSRPENIGIRNALIKKLQRDIVKNSGYNRITSLIQSYISRPF